MVNRVSKRNNVLKALAGTNWGQQKETLLLTYQELGRSIDNYAAFVWSTNASDINLENIQRTQNEELWIITGSHKMSSIDYIHSETKMLLVEDHLKSSLCAISGYTVNTQRMFVTTSPRWIIHRGKLKETVFTRHNQTVLPLLVNIKNRSRQYTPHLSGNIERASTSRSLVRIPASNESLYHATQKKNHGYSTSISMPTTRALIRAGIDSDVDQHRGHVCSKAANYSRSCVRTQKVLSVSLRTRNHIEG